MGSLIWVLKDTRSIFEKKWKSSKSTYNQYTSFLHTQTWSIQGLMTSKTPGVRGLAPGGVWGSALAIIQSFWGSVSWSPVWSGKAHKQLYKCPWCTGACLRRGIGQLSCHVFDVPASGRSLKFQFFSIKFFQNKIHHWPIWPGQLISSHSDFSIKFFQNKIHYRPIWSGQLKSKP